MKAYLVSVDVYPYSHRELEHLHEGNKVSLLCRSYNWQQAGLND
jgi:hypothetical protein